MSNELLYYLIHYGYIALFLLVFSQEVGAPNPVPNELVLFFSGYLAFTGTLNIAVIIFTAFLADILASIILYCVFYIFGKYLLYEKPKWLPISQQSIDKQIKRIKDRGLTGIVVGRLTPFVRGYVSVICGLLHLKPRLFTGIILSTSLIWSCAYVIAGYFLGPYWDFVIKNIDQFKYVMYALLFILFTIMIVRFMIERYYKSTSR